jgi:hypothetical protein
MSEEFFKPVTPCSECGKPYHDDELDCNRVCPVCVFNAKVRIATQRILDMGLTPRDLFFHAWVEEMKEDRSQYMKEEPELDWASADMNLEAWISQEAEANCDEPRDFVGEFFGALQVMRERMGL